MTDKPPREEDMTDMTDEAVRAMLDGATPGRRVQFHGSYCPEAVGTPFTDWDTSHDMSVIRPDGSRYRLAHYKHASDAYLSQMAPDLARALLDARADAQAAVAGVVERCAGSVKAHSETARKKLRETYDVGDADGNALWNCIVTHLDIAEEAIRSIADPTGVKLLAELRAERDALADRLENEMADLNAADRRNKRLAAANAVLEAKVAGLVEAVKPFDAVGGTLFSKNWNMSDIVFDGGPMRSDCLFFEDFLNLRAALATQEAGT